MFSSNRRSNAARNTGWRDRHGHEVIGENRHGTMESECVTRTGVSFSVFSVLYGESRFFLFTDRLTSNSSEYGEEPAHTPPLLLTLSPYPIGFEYSGSPVESHAKPFLGSSSEAGVSLHSVVFLKISLRYE